MVMEEIRGPAAVERGVVGRNLVNVEGDQIFTCSIEIHATIELLVCCLIRAGRVDRKNVGNAVQVACGSCAISAQPRVKVTCEAWIGCTEWEQCGVQGPSYVQTFSRNLT